MYAPTICTAAHNGGDDTTAMPALERLIKTNYEYHYIHICISLTKVPIWGRNSDNTEQGVHNAILILWEILCGSCFTLKIDAQ